MLKLRNSRKACEIILIFLIGDAIPILAALSRHLPGFGGGLHSVVNNRRHDFMIVCFFVLIPTVEPLSFFRSLKHPAWFLPIAFVALAVIGTLWADGPWSARLHGVSPVVKLLAIPFLFYHFERSTRGEQVLIAFLVSCVLLLAMSWIVMFDPALALRSKPLEDYYGAIAYGVPVKNYIDQSQEFSLCAVVLAYSDRHLLRAKRILPAALLIALSLSFIVNMNVRGGVADGAGCDAYHAGGICAASPKMAKRRHHNMRRDCIRRAGVVGIASVALERPKPF